MKDYVSEGQTLSKILHKTSPKGNSVVDFLKIRIAEL